MANQEKPDMIFPPTSLFYFTERYQTLIPDFNITWKFFWGLINIFSIPGGGVG